MLYCMVSRPPAFGKKFKSFDDTETRKIPGVKNVVHAGSVVAVLATNTWAAKKGRDVLKVEWEDTGKLESTTEHIAAFKNLYNKKNEKPDRNDGDAEKALGSAQEGTGKRIRSACSESRANGTHQLFCRCTRWQSRSVRTHPGTRQSDNRCGQSIGNSEANINAGPAPPGRRFWQKNYAATMWWKPRSSLPSPKHLYKCYGRGKMICRAIFTGPTACSVTGLLSITITSSMAGTLRQLLWAAARPQRIISPPGALANYRVDGHSLTSNIQTGPLARPNA